MRSALCMAGALVTLAACGDDDAGAPKTATKAAKPTAAKPAPTPLPDELVGTYTVIGHRNEAFEFPGRWILTLMRTRYRIVNPIHERHGGLLARARNRLYFTDKGCTDEPGVYRWKLIGDRLRLKSVRTDGCNAREMALTFAVAPWRRRS